jgi:hypothetical protein
VIPCSAEEIRLERLADPFDGAAPFGEADHILRPSGFAARLACAA